ncbi:MAG: hypothetical protein RXP97_02555 [Nitrososphaeria archaeon]
MRTLLMISWGPDGGPDGDPEADSAALRGASAIHLYAWNSDGPLDGARYPVAITVKTNTSVVSAVISSLGDFARAISGLMDGPLDPCDPVMIVGYGWAGASLGASIKGWLRLPLVVSLGDSSPTGADLQSAAIRNLEMRAAHESDVVAARSRASLIRMKYEYQVPGDSVVLAQRPEDMASILSRYSGHEGPSP